MNILPLYILSCKNVTSSFFLPSFGRNKNTSVSGPQQRLREIPSRDSLYWLGCAIIFFPLMQHEVFFLFIMSLHVIREHQHNLLVFYDGKKESCQRDKVVSFTDLTEVFSILCLADVLKTKHIDSGNKHSFSHLPSSSPSLSSLLTWII